MKLKHRCIITGILAGLILLSCALKNIWKGFTYCAASLFACLCLYWGAVFIYKYVEDYKWNFEEDFALYKAQTINATSISEQDFEMAKKVYVKRFKRTLVRDKIIDIAKILLCFSLAITSIVAITVWKI